MAIAWPPSLQQFINESGFSLTQQDTNIRSQVETGPIKARRRFTNPQDNMSCQIWLQNVDYNTFKTFYDVTLNNGTLSFDYTHPLTGALDEWRFVIPYTIRVLGGEWFVVNMTWERIP
jgi:hypothetical protein